MTNTNTDGERIAVFDPQPDTTTLIRGRGLFDVLGQFQWATIVPAGMRIPAAKDTIAKAALQAAGYLVTGPGAAAQPKTVGRTALPLPECGHCAQPYPRSYAPDIGEHCTQCGQPLRLIQIDPRTENRATVTGHCRSCGRELTARQRFCRCGTPAITATSPQQPTLTDNAPMLDVIAGVTAEQHRRRRGTPSANYTAHAIPVGTHNHQPGQDGFCTVCQEFIDRKPHDNAHTESQR